MKRSWAITRKARLRSCTSSPAQISSSETDALSSRIDAGVTCTKMLSTMSPQPLGLPIVTVYQVSSSGVATGLKEVASEREALGDHVIWNQAGSGGGTRPSCTGS